MERGPALLCTEGLLAGQRFPITPEGLRIGREPGNEILLDEAGVSRQHARVILHNGAVWVQDAGSRNGILVNGERVPDHKQLKVGDKLSVGSHRFEVVPPAAASAQPQRPAPAAPAVAPARTAAAPARPAAVPGATKSPPAKPKWKIWPFVVAFLLVGAFITCIGVFGAVRDPEGGASAAPTQPAYSLTTMLEPGAGAASVPGAPGPAAIPPAGSAAPVNAAAALAVVAGADPSAALAAVPEPPAGATARQLLDNAQANYDSGRLSAARTQYLQALKLDPACEICSIRADRIQAELQAKVQQSFDAGMRAFDAMQYTQAVSAWETVLMLVPDPADPMHVRAAEYLQRARAAGGGR
jgi:predicted component of type VI protein secretion system